MPTCDTVGVLGAVVATIANFEVTEALKILTGWYSAVSRRMLHIDMWSNDWHQLDVTAAFERGSCPCCRRREFDYLQGRAGSSAEVLCGRNAIQLRHRQRSDPIDLEALASRLASHGEVTVSEFLLSAHLKDGESRYDITLFPDGRAIIGGTHDPETARTIYSRYIGT